MKRNWGLLSCVLIISITLLTTAVSTGAEAARPNAGRPAANHAAAKVDLNTATLPELETLPGVGAATAKEIVAARPFRSVEQLKTVKGIGEARFTELRSHVTVSKPAESAAGAARGSAVAKAPAAARTAASAKVDLNSADQAALETLPGVGGATAKAIIAARPFKSVNDLKQVKGIGEARFAELSPLVTVRPSPRAGAHPAAGAPAPAARGGSSESAGKAADQKSSGAAAGAKVNVNTASREELEGLLGIGPVKAQAIIDGRPYNSVEDLMNVKGIKEGTFGEIRDRVRVR